MASSDRGEIAQIILDALPVGVCATDNDGVPLYDNRASRSFGMLLDRETDTDQGELPISVDNLRVGDGSDGINVFLTQDISAQRKLEDDLFQRAYFDSLTGLPNAAMAGQSMATLADGEDQAFALAFFDLDRFRKINEYYGNDIGDALLIKIAERLSRELRPTDMLARVGGNEFVLLLSPVQSFEQIEEDLGRYLDLLKTPFFVEGHEIITSASVGVSTFPADGDTYAQLRAAADTAMTTVKDGMRGEIRFYDASVSRTSKERMRMEQRVRLAVRDRRVCCAYQPKVDFRSDEVKGVEVLLRWRDENGAIQPPGEFIGLALELGLMDDIAHQVLDETLENIDRINDAFGEGATISINIAAIQADNPVFMRTIVDKLVDAGCAERFLLELTEEAFLSGSSFQEKVLPMVRESGAKVSIDDFGTGYSSLSALADITADEIKVDRSFITDIHKKPRSQSILKAVESLATALDMSIIVEGVETKEELLYLQAATNIRLAQGYYFAKPMFLDQYSEQQTPMQGSRSLPDASRGSQSRRSSRNRG